MQRTWLTAHKGLLTIIGLLAAIMSGSIIIQAWAIVQVVNAVFIEQQAFATLTTTFLWLALAFAVRAIANYLLSVAGGRLAQAVKQHVRQQLLDKWFTNALETHANQLTGEKTSLYIDTVEQLESYYRDYIPQLMKSTFVPLVALIVVFFTHANSGWIMLVTAPFIPFTYIIIGLQTKRKAEEQLDAMNRFSGTFLDVLQGMQTIRLFRQQEKQTAQLQQSNTNFTERTMSVLKIAFASTLFIEMITTLGIGIVALEIGLQMIVFQSLAFAPAFIILTLAPEYYNALKDLGAAFHTGKGSQGAAQLIADELARDTRPVQWGQKALPDAPSLTLQHASYRYKEGVTIGPIDVHIPFGTKLAIIGPTGHGKTTLLHLLASTIELTDGELFIGESLRATVAQNDWYKQMSYISQQPYIFAASVRDNVCFGIEASDEEVWYALEQVQLSQLVQRLPDGLETTIGEGGIGFSGGEKQRLALARAFLQKPTFLFLDEPTANVDAKTEEVIMQAVHTLGHLATVIIVSHRFQTIQQMERIIYIENGQIGADGSHEQLHHLPFYEKMKGATSR